MLTPSGRRALERYALERRDLSRASGERTAREAGRSVEFHDFRPYLPGDDLRAVDWRAYARSGRLLTRLYRAERSIDVHVLLDVSASMALWGRIDVARILAAAIAHVAHRDATVRVHTTAGISTPPAGREALGRIGELLAAVAVAPDALGPVDGVRRFALSLPRVRGAALCVVISDLLDPAPWREALTALRARSVDAFFLQLLAMPELHPPLGRFDLEDVETSDRRTVGPDEVRAYETALQAFLARLRSALHAGGFGHALLVTDPDVAGGEARERAAIRELVRARLLVPR
jgi:uncharacterized protein (DUF58 family)